MIIYNVTIKVENEIANDWVTWMKEVHIPDLFTTGLFTECRLCHLLEQDETEGITYSAQYMLITIEDYNTYIDKHAPEMRDKAFKRFGNKFIAFRSIMEIV